MTNDSLTGRASREGPEPMREARLPCPMRRRPDLRAIFGEAGPRMPDPAASLDIYRRSEGVRDDFRWSSRLLPTGRGRDSRIVIERVTVDRRGLRPDEVQTPARY